MKMLLARIVLWLCFDFCECCHHFNVTPEGRPGCVGNWRWRGLGPNRWLAWAMDYEDANAALHKV